MTDIFAVPGALDILDWWLLVAASFATSLMTAVFGMGGGITLLAAMAQLLPAPAVIPVHAVVQAGSNMGRACLLLKHIQWPFIGAFVVGAVIGSAVGGRLVVTLPIAILQGVLGLFILFVVWGPKIPSWASGNLGVLAQGFVSTILTFFVGATGPFIAAALHPRNLPALQHVATFGAAMTLQHLLKISVFFALGFQFRPYLSLMLAMLLTGLVGTLIGTRVLKKRRNGDFQRWLNIILTVLGLRLLTIAAGTWF